MSYFLIFLAGLVFGSFFNVCIYRIPLKQSILHPVSQCMYCGGKLSSIEMLPVLGYLILKGRCRKCNNRISVRYPIVELLTAALFTILLARYKLSWEFAVYAFLVSILIISSFIDLKHRIIPNGLVLTGTIGGIAFVLLGISTDPLDAFLGLLAGGGVLFLIAFLCIVILKKEGMGGGDIKLMGMIGLFLGWQAAILSLMLSIYIGGIAGAVLIIFRRKKRGDFIPYGPFIGIGTVITVLYGQEIINFYLSLL